MNLENERIYRKCRIGLEADLAHLRLQDTLKGLEHALHRYRKAGYDPSEPRDDHGRWANGGGQSDVPSNAADTTVLAESFYAARQRCIEECTDKNIPTGTLDGAPFHYCYARCMENAGHATGLL